MKTMDRAKRVAFEALYETGAMVRLHLDPRRAGVVLPDHLAAKVQLILEVGLGLPLPTRDLDADDERVCVTLSFARTPFGCVVPWSAVYALDGSGDGSEIVVWSGDVPDEMRAPAVAPVPSPARGTRAAPPKEHAAPKRAPSGVRPAHLKVIK